MEFGGVLFEALGRGLELDLALTDWGSLERMMSIFTLKSAEAEVQPIPKGEDLRCEHETRVG